MFKDLGPGCPAWNGKHIYPEFDMYRKFRVWIYRDGRIVPHGPLGARHRIYIQHAQEGLRELMRSTQIGDRRHCVVCSRGQEFVHEISKLDWVKIPGGPEYCVEVRMLPAPGLGSFEKVRQQGS